MQRTFPLAAFASHNIHSAWFRISVRLPSVLCKRARQIRSGCTTHTPIRPCELDSRLEFHSQARHPVPEMDNIVNKAFKDAYCVSFYFASKEREALWWQISIGEFWQQNSRKRSHDTNGCEHRCNIRDANPSTRSQMTIDPRLASGLLNRWSNHHVTVE